MARKRPDPSRARSPRDAIARPAIGAANLRASSTAADPKGPAHALWILLTILALARGIAPFVPGMWAWGLDSLRFVAAPAWLPWVLAVAALLPPFSTRVLGWLEGIATQVGSIGRWEALAWGVVPAVMVWLLPDRVLFVGDSLLREHTGHTTHSVFASLYPQGLPMDAFLHDTLQRTLAAALGSSANEIARLLGALEAAVLGALAYRFTHILKWKGQIALATGAVIVCTGTLALFTGYNKAFAEITLLAVAIAVFGLEAARRGNGLLPLGLALALGLSLHRLALAFVPAAAVAWVLALRAGGTRSGRERALDLAGVLAPLVTLAVLGPRLWRLITTFDRTGNFAPSEVHRQGGVIAAAFAALHAIDVANVILLLAPLAPVVLLVPLIRWTPERRREAMVLGALILPLVGFVPFFHPPQGVFRDWDAFGASAMALSLGAAWTIGALLVDRPEFRWLSLAVFLGAAAPTLAWLGHNASVERGFARVEAYLAGPPARGDLATASDWDYLGLRYADVGRTDEAAAAFTRAAEIAPSPKTLRAWAATEVARGNLAKAQELFRRVAVGSPAKPEAWLDLARVSFELGDTVETRRAAGEALRLRPGDERAREMLDRVTSRP